MTLTAIRTAWRQQLEQHRAIAVIRAPTAAAAYNMASAVAAGQLPLIEITWTTPQAAQVVAQLRADFPQHCIGAGTILSTAALEQAAAAGAQFVFSPHTDTALIQAAHHYQIPTVPGALSPSEIVAAWHAGAASVKVFPVGALGGATYIRALQGPLGHIPLVPSGGVTIETAVAFLQAGAAAVGLSTVLFPQDMLETESWNEVTQRVQQLIEQIKPLCASAAPTKAVQR